MNMLVLHTLFFVKNYPCPGYYEDVDYFMAEVGDDLRKVIFEGLGPSAPEQKFFAPGNKPLTGVAVRARGKKESDALADARDTVDGFLDAISLMAYDGQPKVSKITLVASPAEKNLRFVSFFSEAFFEFGGPLPKPERIDNSRADEIASMMVPLIDISAGTHSRGGSALAEQLAYALKMFRYGSAAGAYPIEFICKFTAMESLVCGGERGTKKANLLARLPRLFPNDAKLTPAYFSELWDTRNSAVHEARGFHREKAKNVTRVQGHLENLNRIVLTVVSYATSHLEKADSVQALWSLPTGYLPPEFTKTFRPQAPGTFRLESRNIVMNLGISLPEAHMIFARFIKPDSNSAATSAS